jgi:hypothetical protein
VLTVLSPYTYTWENFDEAKSQIISRRKEIFATGMMCLPLMLFYLSSRARRIKRAKNEFYLNQMMKRKFLADEMGLKPQKMRLDELKTLLKESGN